MARKKITYEGSNATTYVDEDVYMVTPNGQKLVSSLEAGDTVCLNSGGYSNRPHLASQLVVVAVVEDV